MTELTKGNTTTIILALLRMESMYGYQIVKQMNDRHMDIMQMNEGTVYPLLHNLERQGLVTGKWRRVEHQRARKYYELTADGEKVLERSISRWRRFSSALDSLIGSTP
ncbi:MAG: helix-turn-helix transcriptional regulator [Actinomycetota bacterium]